VDVKSLSRTCLASLCTATLVLVPLDLKAEPSQDLGEPAPTITETPDLGAGDALPDAAPGPVSDSAADLDSQANPKATPKPNATPGKDPWIVEAKDQPLKVTEEDGLTEIKFRRHAAVYRLVKSNPAYSRIRPLIKNAEKKHLKLLVTFNLKTLTVVDAQEISKSKPKTKANVKGAEKVGGKGAKKH
jgi:hypothetical protein